MLKLAAFVIGNCRLPDSWVSRGTCLPGKLLLDDDNDDNDDDHEDDDDEDHDIAQQ